MWRLALDSNGLFARDPGERSSFSMRDNTGNSQQGSFPPFSYTRFARLFPIALAFAY